MSYSLYLPRIVHEEYNIGVSSEAKYAVKPKKQSQGGLSGAIISTPDPLDFLEMLKGSSKRQGEQLLRYNPQSTPTGCCTSTATASLDQVGRAVGSINFTERNLGFRRCKDQ